MFRRQDTVQPLSRSDDCGGGVQPSLTSIYSTAANAILPEGMSERRPRFDNKRGLDAVYGIPALAGSALSLKRG